MYVNKAIEVTDDSFLEIKTSCSTMQGVLTSFCGYEVSGSFKLFCCAERDFVKYDLNLLWARESLPEISIFVWLQPVQDGDFTVFLFGYKAYSIKYFKC